MSNINSNWIKYDLENLDKLNKIKSNENKCWLFRVSFDSKSEERSFKWVKLTVLTDYCVLFEIIGK